LLWRKQCENTRNRFPQGGCYVQGGIKNRGIFDQYLALSPKRYKICPVWRHWCRCLRGPDVRRAYDVVSSSSDRHSSLWRRTATVSDVLRRRCCSTGTWTWPTERCPSSQSTSFVRGRRWTTGCTAVVRATAVADRPHTSDSASRSRTSPPGRLRTLYHYPESTRIFANSKARVSDSDVEIHVGLCSIN